MECKGVTIKVDSIDTTDGEGFMIHGAVANTKNTYINSDVFMLRPEDLDDLVEYLKIDIRDEIIDTLQKLFNVGNAYVIAVDILDAVIGEEINGHSLSEAVNIVLMRKMSLKL